MTIQKGVATGLTQADIEGELLSKKMTLEGWLNGIDNFNRSFQATSQELNTGHFSGEFIEAMVAELEQEMKMSMELQADCYSKVQELTQVYRDFLYEIDAQDYMYEIEILSIDRTNKEG